MKSDLARFGRGFVYAWNGICAAVREERNFRFHLCAAVYVFAAAWLAELDRQSVALLALCVFSMLGMELMNSAVERAVDKPDTTHWWSAGAAKDMAAGGVLATAVGTVVVGVCLFGRAETLRLLQVSFIRQESYGKTFSCCHHPELLHTAERIRHAFLSI